MMDTETINRRFNEFRDWCRTHVYSEPDTQLHMTVMNDLIPQLVEHEKLTGEHSILDVGCGQGYGMLKFKELGCSTIKGITLSPEDVEASVKRGFECTQQDMSFTDFADGEFDFLFVRHALEHSPYPLLTLKEFNRILKVGGRAYIEMPSPKCERLLEAFDNHYSIMGPRQWLQLMERAKFAILNCVEINLNITLGDWSGAEVYETYILRKEESL